MGKVIEKKKSSIKRDKVLKHANKKLPDFPLQIAHLDEEYNGTWNFETAAHLLRRTTFGPKLSEIEKAVILGKSASINKLLSNTEFIPEPPINVKDDEDTEIPIGQTWVNASKKKNDFIRRASYAGWRIGLILNQPHTGTEALPFSIREKMVLFWQNHFASEADVVGDARYYYWFHNKLRKNYLGNFKNLVKKINVDPAMLVYLSGQFNTKEAPNENYARELFELFTIGKGPLDGVDSYTYYTESDIIEASKILTGWEVIKNFSGPDRQKFTSSRHDTSSKTFSSKFNNKVIHNNGEKEHEDLINMIFDQERTSEYICEKLYRWFIYYVIDGEVTDKIIKPLAKILRENNFEIKPVLEKLLHSKHFFEIHTRGALIKSPIDYNFGILRQVPLSDYLSLDIKDQYGFWTKRTNDIRNQSQDIINHPSVAGWPAYYQSPLFQELWINSVTLPLRTLNVNQYLSNNGMAAINPGTVYAKPIKLLDEISEPDNIDYIIELFCKWFFPIYSEITPSQKEDFKNIVVGNNPNMWKDEYTDYINDPTPAKEISINKRLKDLIKEMFKTPEYHLS